MPRFSKLNFSKFWKYFFTKIKSKKKPSAKTPNPEGFLLTRSELRERSFWKVCLHLLQGVDYTRRAGGPKGLHQLLMSAYVSLLVPWNSILRLWNLQNPVPKTSKTPTFGTLKLQFSPLKRSKSGPQNLKIVHFWVPFLDRILNVSRAKFGVSRSQKELKMTQKCNNCFGIVRTHTDRQTDARTDRRTWKFWTTTQ